MADNPKWAKQEEDKAEQEERMKQQQRRERAKSDASDVPKTKGVDFASMTFNHIILIYII